MVLILELESCHCALRILGTGNTGQQENGEPEALGTTRTGSPNQWTLGILWAQGPEGHWGHWRCGGLGHWDLFQFRNGTLLFNAPTETFQTMPILSLPCFPFSLPSVAGWRGDTKDKDLRMR